MRSAKQRGLSLISSNEVKPSSLTISFMEKTAFGFAFTGLGY